MTSESPPTTDLDRHDAIRWAKHSLDIADRDGIADVATTLNQVTKQAYVLPPDSVNAAIVLVNGQDVDTTLAIRYGREQRLANDVQQFAAVFFERNQFQRAQRWQELAPQCESIPALHRWLQHLGSGISLTEMPIPATETVGELLLVCCKVFTSRQPERIRRQQEFIAMCRERPDFWEPLVLEFLSHNSQFAKLIAPWLKQIRLTPVPPPKEPEKVVVAKANIARPPSNSRNSSNRNSGMSYLWVIVAVSAISRLVSNFHSSHQASPVVGRPPYGSQRDRAELLSQYRLPRTTKLDPTGVSQLDSFENEELTPSEFSFKNFPQESLNQLLIDFPELRVWLNDAKKREDLDGLVRRDLPDLARAIVIHCRTKKRQNPYYYAGFADDDDGEVRQTLQRFRLFLAELDRLSTKNSDDQPASALNPANGSDAP